jgi:hypothetical protein
MISLSCAKKLRQQKYALLSVQFCQLDIVTHICQMAEKWKDGFSLFSSLINSIFGKLSAKDAKIQFRFVRMPIYSFQHF